MIINTPAQRLRIIIDETEKTGHTPLYEAIVHEARQAGLAGATVWRGLMSYGHTSHIHTSKILELASDLTIVVEMVDSADKIERFLPALAQLFQQAGCDGLITREDVQAIHFESNKSP